LADFPVSYLWQAARGQFALQQRTRPIEQVLRDERTSEREKRLLGAIPGIKAFGEREGLKATANYVDYVRLDRPYVVWAVSASAELEFKPKLWKFPVVGSVPYLGWYDRGEAERFAEKLRREGWDAEARGVGAYSTLGWFRDPVLSSMLTEGAAALGELAQLILHESVHATLYVPDQSVFNESLASFVAEKLTPKYLAELPRAPGGGEDELRAYLESERRAEARAESLHAAYQELARVYASGGTPAEKRAEKERVLTGLGRELGLSPQRRLGNATLLQFRTYGAGRAEFAALLAVCEGSWPRFWAALRRLDEKAFGSPQREDIGVVLRQLISMLRPPDRT
jgi:predicted aminopeptidase